MSTQKTRGLEDVDGGVVLVSTSAANMEICSRNAICQGSAKHSFPALEHLPQEMRGSPMISMLWME